MPSVNSSGIIAVSSEYISIIRGQQASHTISLHKNFVGNAINIGAITEVVAEYVNTDNQIFKTESKTANTLVFGAANGDTQNQISISLTAAETAALPLNDNNVNGECWVRKYRELDECSMIPFFPSIVSISSLCHGYSINLNKL